MLKIENLTKKFKKQTVLNNLSLQIKQPGLYLLVGTNGSGKSTLFNSITGLQNSFEGTIMLNGKSNPDERRCLSGISNEPFFTEPFLSVQKIITIAQSIKKTDSQKVKELTKFWELNDTLDKPFKQLSTGMKKRLSLLLSLMGNPEYLFWDEPFNGLDPLGIDILTQLIDNLSKQGKYIFISTHLINELHGLKATFLVLNNGNIKVQTKEEKLDDHTKETILQLLKTKK